MLRFALGFGGAGATSSLRNSRAEDVKLSGGGATFSFDIGGAPIDNLVIHFRLSDFSILSPDVKVGGEKVETSDNSLVAVLMAPAITYYFMPANLYLTGSVGISWLEVTDEYNDYTSSTDPGVGLNIDFGKEWWVSDNWGLGVAGRFWSTFLTDKIAGGNYKIDYSFLGGAVLFSATYQ